MKVGLIGCGAIGKVIARAIMKGKIKCELSAVFDLDKESVESVLEIAEGRPRAAGSIDDLLDQDLDLVIEAASQKAVSEYSVKILNRGKDLMIMSVGALVDDALFKEIKNTAEEKGRKVYLPSGAICGIDGVKAASVERLSEVMLVSRKNPKNFDLEIDKEKIIFEGNAREAAKKFPKSINVAACLSLAGIGAEKTRVRIIADPSINRNIHEVHARGEFGELVAKTMNVRCPENVKTSYLAALSAIRVLQKITEAVQVGT